MRIYKPIDTKDGAGVVLKRYIGVEPSYVDPFLLLDEFKSANPKDYIAGFPEHPHRGFQTLTYMIKGRLKHKDSTGKEEILEDMTLQWMNAGSGVIHSEIPMMKDGFLWGFQLWLNNPASQKMSKPFYYNYKPKILTNANDMKILDLGYLINEKGFYPITYLHVELKRGAWFDFKFQENTFLALSEGAIEINDTIDFSKLLVLEEDAHIRALEDAMFLIASAKPLKEPVVRYGPFVMNTREQIEKSIIDYKSGKFVV